MSNPVFDYAERNYENEVVIDQSQIMTLKGTINASLMMGLIMVVAAAFTWGKVVTGDVSTGAMLTGAGALIGFILAIIVCFTRKTFLIPFYAACEGLFLGGISAQMEAMYPGIVTQAVAATFATLFGMLILYQLGIIRATEKFRSVVIIATASIAIIYLVNIVAGFFGYSMPVLYASTPAGIAVSVIICVIAALNLIIDFENIEIWVSRMAPKDYEWFGAFGLMVTLVWLYIEILRLLAKLNRR